MTDIDLASAAFRRDPYPAYRRLQDEEPVHFSDAWNAWLITRHADAEAAFKDARFSANRSSGYAATLPEPVKQALRPLLENLSRWTLLIDPPDHTRLRALIAKAFTPTAVAAMQPRIAALVDELLAKHDGAPTLDVIAELAGPLPTIVIGDMLGIPAKDAGKLKAWSDALASFMGASAMQPAIVQQAVRAVVEMETYLRGVMDEHRKAPKDDLMSRLMAAEEQGASLSEAELFATCTSLLFGGHETTTNLIGNAVLSLARHPAELARLRNDPALLSSAVEEVLRYEAPVQRMGRVALEDVELHGRVLPKGARVFMVMGACNRDPRRFADADRFDVARSDNRHLTFGHGIHFCVGAALGRLEARLALQALVARRDALRVVDGVEVEWLDNLTVRGVKSLPIAWA